MHRPGGRDVVHGPGVDVEAGAPELLHVGLVEQGRDLEIDAVRNDLLGLGDHRVGGGRRLSLLLLEAHEPACGEVGAQLLHGRDHVRVEADDGRLLRREADGLQDAAQLRDDLGPVTIKANVYALYPHFRADGWLYFVVRDMDAQLEYIVASDVAVRLASQQ